MKFKVGDKVRVRDDLKVGEEYNGYLFVKEMEKYKGKIFNILNISEIAKCYGLSEVETEWKYCFTDKMLEPVKENKENTEKIIITREGSKMVGEYYKNGNMIEIQLPYYTNELDFCENAKVVIDRINKMMGVKDYSLVKCVGYRQNYEFYFTIDKVYKIYNNGRITDDKGFTYCSKDSKEEMLKFLSRWYLFEEVEK